MRPPPGRPDRSPPAAAASGTARPGAPPRPPSPRGRAVRVRGVGGEAVVPARGVRSQTCPRQFPGGRHQSAEQQPGAQGSGLTRRLLPHTGPVRGRRGRRLRRRGPRLPLPGGHLPRRLPVLETPRWPGLAAVAGWVALRWFRSALVVGFRSGGLAQPRWPGSGSVVGWVPLRRSHSASVVRLSSDGPVQPRRPGGPGGRIGPTALRVRSTGAVSRVRIAFTAPRPWVRYW
ncbi:hypothetical protein QF037_002649 [Streptomyces canus]|nr:hypothetical protein [Streptomyces canus]